MKFIFPAIFVTLLAFGLLWNSSLQRLLRWLEARPMAHFPVWREVKARMERIARRERLPAPTLWILPEFSPNAFVARKGKAVHIALSEGLLRALDSNELDAVLGLCLAHGAAKRRGLQTQLALQLFPIARFLQSYPAIVQIFLSPWLTALTRLVAPHSLVLGADKKSREAIASAAALQKLAVLGRKIPLRHWNFALDPLFLLSPLALDGGPFWVFLSQPSVEDRRKALLDSAACETAAGLT